MAGKPRQASTVFPRREKVLEELSMKLDHDDVSLSYLDDVYIFSGSCEVEAAAERAISRVQTTLAMNSENAGPTLWMNAP